MIRSVILDLEMTERIFGSCAFGTAFTGTCPTPLDITRHFHFHFKDTGMVGSADFHNTIMRCSQL